MFANNKRKKKLSKTGSYPAVMHDWRLDKCAKEKNNQQHTWCWFFKLDLPAIPRLTNRWKIIIFLSMSKGKRLFLRSNERSIAEWQDFFHPNIHRAQLGFDITRKFTELNYVIISVEHTGKKNWWNHSIKIMKQMELI